MIHTVIWRTAISQPLFSISLSPVMSMTLAKNGNRISLVTGTPAPVALSKMRLRRMPSSGLLTGKLPARRPVRSMRSAAFADLHKTMAPLLISCRAAALRVAALRVAALRAAALRVVVLRVAALRATAAPLNLIMPFLWIRPKMAASPFLQNPLLRETL